MYFLWIKNLGKIKMLAMVIFDLYDQMIEYILFIILCVLYDVFL